MGAMGSTRLENDRDPQTQQARLSCKEGKEDCDSTIKWIGHQGIMKIPDQVIKKAVKG